MKRIYTVFFVLLAWIGMAEVVRAQCPVPADFSISSTKDATCFGGSDGQMVVQAKPGVNTALYNFLLRDLLAPGIPIVTDPLGPVTVTIVGNTITFNNLSASSYIMQVTRKSPACNINVFSGVPIGEPAELLLSVASQTDITGCFGDNTGAFAIAATGGNSGFQYSVDGGANYQVSNTFSGLGAGTYSVTVKDSKGCTNTIDVVLAEPPALQLVVSAQANPACAGNANGSITIAATGGTAPYEYSKDDGATYGASNVFAALSGGTYNLAVRDSKGCVTKLAGITLTEPPALQIAFDSQLDVLGCFGDATGEIKVTATGGTGGYTYSKDGSIFTANGGNFTGLAAGTYTIVAKDANGCTISLAPVTLAQPAQLTLALVSQTNITGCFGDKTGAITVLAAGGQPAYEYSIDNGTIFQASNVFGGLAAGNYTILVRDTKGCTATLANTALSQPTAVAASLASQNPLCKGANNGSVTITATGGTAPYSYSINGGAPQASNVFTGLVAGTYTVKVIDNNNCEVTLPALTLTEPDLLTVAVSSQKNIETCAGDANGEITVAATGGTPAYQYSIDNGATFQGSPTFTGLLAGNYTILVRDAQNCTVSSVPVTLAEPPALVLALGSQTDITGCFGDATGTITVSATGGTAPYAFSKDGSVFQATGNFTGLAAGNYTTTVRDSKNCVKTVAVTLSQPAQLAASLTAKQDVGCFGAATGEISVGASGGTAPYTYSKDGTNFQASNAFAGLAAGSYTITIRDSKNCEVTVPGISLAQAPQLTVSISAQKDISCNGGTDGIIGISVTGGTAPYVFSTDGITFTANGGSFTGLAAGTYTLVVRDANGCTATLNPVTLSAPAVLQATATATDAGCNGTTTGSVTVSATGGTAPYGYSINGGAPQASNVLAGLASGNYTILVTDGKGCTVTLSNVSVGQPQALALVASATDASCNGASDGTASVLVSGGTAPYTYAWNTTPVQSSSGATGLPAGTYTVTVTDAKGCVQTASVPVAQPAVLAAPVAASPAPICTGGAVPQLTATGTNIQWYGDAALATLLGSGNSFTPSINNAIAGNSIFYATQISGVCKSPATAVTVTINPAPAVPNISGSLNICSGGNTILTSSTASGNQWFLNGNPVAGATGQTLAVSASGSYTVQVTENGCTAVSPAVTVTQTVVAVPTITGNPTFCTASNTVLTSSATAGNQWLLNGSPVAGATNQTLAVTAAGSYSVTVTESGCSATSVPVALKQSDLAATVLASNPNCTDPSSGALTVSASGGAAPYGYSLDGTDFSNTTGVFGALAANNYTIYVRDAAGCVVTRTQSLSATPGITAATLAPANESGCAKADGSVTVSGIAGAGGPYQYFINGTPNPAGINSNVFAGLVANTYSIRIVAANGCDLTQTVAVGTDCITCKLAASVASQTDPTCKGNDGTITLASADGIGTVSYSIDGGTNFNTNPVFANLAAGSYAIVVKDGNGCVVNAGTVTLTPPVAIAATVSGSNPATCNVNDGTITVASVTGGKAPYQFSLDGVNYQAASTFSGLAGNSYTVSVRDADGCVNTFAQTITAPDGISTVTVNTISESGCLTLDGSVTVNAVGGKTPYKYYLNGTPNPAGINNNVFSGLEGKVYAIRVETADGCFFTTTAAVGTNCTTPCTLAATVTNTDLACNNAGNGQITVAALGGTGLYEYSLDGTSFQTAAIFNGLASGNYTVTIRDRNNPACEITRNAIITNPPAITGAVSATINPSCQNNDGSLTVTASGGTGALQYALNGGTYTNSLTFNGLAAGTYAVTAKDANNCVQAIGTATLTAPAAIAATATGTNPTTCAATDGQITVSNVLNGTAPYQYSLDGVAFQASATLTGLADGVYQVVVKDANGCTATLPDVTLKVNVTITATLVPANPSSCATTDGSITINGAAGGAAPYQYSLNGGPFQSGNAFTNLAGNGTAYTITIKDANGCTATLTITLTAPNSITAISISAADETSCNGKDGTITVSSVTGGKAPYQYFINGIINPAGANSNVFGNLAGGSYTIRVLTADGCDFTAASSVKQACCLQAAVSTTTQPGCAGNDGSITLSATNGVGTVQYSINGGTTFVTTNVFMGLASGNYTILVRDSLCQKDLGIVTLTGVPLAAILSGTNPSGCSSANGQITVSNVTGGTAPYQYSLDGVNYAASATFANLSGGNYSVFLKDAGGCIINLTQSLAATGGILSLETVTVSESGCSTKDGQITVTNVTGSAGPYQYFVDGVLNPAGGGNNVFNGLSSGPHQVRVVAANGCDFLTNVVVGSNCVADCNATAAITAQTNPTCVGNDGSLTVGLSGGSGAITYSIDGGNTFVTTNVFTGLASGNYTILVRYGAGCQTSVSATLTLPAIITATVSGTNPTGCGLQDGVISITNASGGTAPYRYSIDGTNYRINATFSGLTDGSYTIYAKDANGCTATFTQVLATAGGIVATVGVTDETACAANDGTIRINASGTTGAVEYYLNGSPNPAGINSNVFANLAPGSYLVRVVDTKGCEYSTTSTITKFTCPVTCTLNGNITSTDPNCISASGGSIQVFANAGTAPYTYSINGSGFVPGSGVFTGLAPGDYLLRIKDANNCILDLPGVRLIPPTAPNSMSVSTTKPANCSANDGTIKINSVSGGTQPYLYSLDGVNYDVADVFGGLAAGSYTVYAKDAKGCMITRSVSVTATGGGITSITANIADESACDARDGKISVLTVSGGIGAIQYSINGSANPNGEFINLAPGNYTIGVQDANGCKFSRLITIKKAVCTPVCTLSATASQTEPTCANPNGGTISVAAIGGTAPYQYSINGSTTNSGTFGGLTAGFYVISIRDANSCEFKLDTIRLADIGKIAASISLDSETACKANDGKITVSVTGGTAPYKYYLNGTLNPAGNVFGALLPNTYTIRVTDASNCEFTTTATVKTFTCPPPTCTITAQAFSNPVLCNGVSDGTAILINISGGSGAYEFSIDNGATYQANPQFNSLAAGNYTILARDRNNVTCTAPFPVTIATKFDVAGIIIVNQPKTCGDKGQITFTNVFGGQAPYQFSVNGTTFGTDTAFADLLPGKYQATIRDAKNCRFSAEIAIIGGQAITATVAQGQPASCRQADGTIIITNASGGSGVFVYSLDGTTFSGNTTFDKLAAGAYTVYVKEQNGSCVATFPVIVAATDCCKLTLNPTLTQPSACTSVDGRITVAVTDGSAPFTYRLNNGAPQNSNVFGGLGNGNYTILVRDATGCEASVTVTLSSPNAITAQVEQVTPASCFGKADGSVRVVSVSGGSGSHEYSMDGAAYQNSPLFANLKAGIYILYARDKASGCLASYPVTVNEATQITATVTPASATVCAAKDGSIRITSVAGGVGPYQYSLDSLTNYQTTDQFNGLGNGIYKVYIKDTRGCVAVYAARVSSPNAINVGTPVLLNPTCQGSNNGEIRTGTVTGGQAPYQYSLNNGAYQPSGIFTALPAGNYTLKIKDQSGCEYPFEYTLTEPAAIAFDVRQTRTPTCADPTGSVEVINIVGGLPPYRYSLNGIDFQNSPVFGNLNPGDYIMYVRDVSKNTCASTKPFTIRGAKRVAFEVKAVNIGCSNTDKGSIAVYRITGGIETGSPVEYGISINGGNTFRYISNDSTFFANLDAGIYDIVIEYGTNCKTAAQRVTINAGAIPFSVATTPATCGAANGSATVDIANPIPGKVYYYSMDNLNYFTTPGFPSLRSGSYRMYVRENRQDTCANIKSFVVPGPDSVRYVIRRQDCNTVIVDSIRGGVAPYRISISGRAAITTGELFVSRYVFPNLQDGEYTMTVTDKEGCSTFPFNFRVGNRISYKVKTTPSVLEEPTGGVQIYDITGGQPPYEVSVDGQRWTKIKDRTIPIDTLITGLPVGLLKVYIRDANGCIKQLDAEVKELKFVVPNIFTPNGDGFNDTFFITKLPSGTFMTIVDRWGRVVFESRDYKNDWDGGTYPDGVYFYTIDIAGEQTYRGWVQVWRRAE